MDWEQVAPIIGALGGLAGAGVVLKAMLDWHNGRGSMRLSAEDQIRSDLLEQNQELRHEIAVLRDELADSRREVRRVEVSANKRLRDCEDRATSFQRALAELRGELDTLKRSHGTA